MHQIPSFDMSTKPFYNHISGLRGIAIILVILFHLNSTCFPHGFYGVDVFLVITGYLLFLSFTRNGNHLDIKEFATKKLLRIFPPMITAILLILIGSIFFQDCVDVVTTGRTGRHALFCDVNYFLNELQSDYFAADALNNPFLHMWYLAVTIHLYIIFAVGCVAYRYLSRKVALILVCIVGVSSFCYSYSYQLLNILHFLHLPTWEQNIPTSHYTTLPRVWELLAGGAILLLPNNTSRIKASILSLLGLVAVLLPALSAHNLAAYGAPFVVLGTMLIIRYMPGSRLMPILSNKLILWVGAISFSLYLVHMPIIAFYRAWNVNTNGWSDYSIQISFIIVLSYLFWRGVEKRRLNKYLVMGLWCISMLICALSKKTEGFKDYVYPELNSIHPDAYSAPILCKPDVLANKLDTTSLAPYSPNATGSPLFQMGPESTTPSVILIGDSHAHIALYGLDKMLGRMNIPGAFVSSIILPFWDIQLHQNATYYYTKERAEALLQWLEANPSITHVVIAQYWSLRFVHRNLRNWDNSPVILTPETYYQHLRDFILQIKALNKHVILLGPAPKIPHKTPAQVVRIAKRKKQDPMDLSAISCTRKSLLEKNIHILPMLNKLKDEGICSLVDTISYLPEDEPWVSYQNGQFLMNDDNHLTEAGSIHFFEYLQPQFELLLKQAQPVIKTP